MHNAEWVEVFRKKNLKYSHLYHKWDADQVKVSCKNHDQEKEWATSLYFLIMTVQKSRLMSNLRILKLLSENQLGNYLLERLPTQKTNYGRERMGGGALCWSCYWSFQPTIEINEQWSVQMHSATKKSIRKTKETQPSTSPGTAIIRNIFSEAHCRQTPGPHWRL